MLYASMDVTLLESIWNGPFKCPWNFHTTHIRASSGIIFYVCQIAEQALRNACVSVLFFMNHTFYLIHHFIHQLVSTFLRFVQRINSRECVYYTQSHCFAGVNKPQDNGRTIKSAYSFILTPFVGENIGFALSLLDRL